jgi:hypothetical protein
MITSRTRRLAVSIADSFAAQLREDASFAAVSDPVRLQLQGKSDRGDRSLEGIQIVTSLSSSSPSPSPHPHYQQQQHQQQQQEQEEKEEEEEVVCCHPIVCVRTHYWTFQHHYRLDFKKHQI